MQGKGLHLLLLTGVETQLRLLDCHPECERCNKKRAALFKYYVTVSFHYE